MLLGLITVIGFNWPVQASSDGWRRFAILVGNNDGGSGTKLLHYANRDVTRINEILTRLGGVHTQDSVLLLEKSADDLRRAFEILEPRIQQAANRGDRPLLVVYFSGHAKDSVLRMGSTAIALEEVKRMMSRSAAEIRLGLFDSCRSGIITRAKGARHAPAFEVDAKSLQTARGLVMLTSSSADEDSQESDELQGSFFSHHLTSGLLGAADTSGDGRISLAEAYAYAYERTVADTTDTAAGPQHPTFSYDLAGSGDVILTDVITRHEGVILPTEAPAGKYFLVDSKGMVAAEVAKVADTTQRIALAPGIYRIKRRLPDRLRIGEITVAPGAAPVIDERLLHDAPFTDDPVKGIVQLYRSDADLRFGASLGGGYQYFFIGPMPSMPLLGAELSLRGNYIWSLDFGLGGGEANISAQNSKLSYRFSELSLGISMTREWTFGPVSPFVGARLAALLISRKFDDPGVPHQSYFMMPPGLVLGLRVNLNEYWSITSRTRGHFYYYNVDSPQSVGYIESSLLLSYER